MVTWIVAGSVGVVVLFVVLLLLLLRRVVPTNEFHIVQSSEKTTTYGKESGHGNTYSEWPSWLPVIGVNKIVLPVSVFDLDPTDYNTYDRDRWPFKVHVWAFFRISDSNKAA